MLTMGVAIAVPEPYGEQLRASRASFGDPRAATVPSHITLSGPLEVAERDVDDVVDRLTKAAQDHAPFDLVLRGTETFRPITPVVYIAVVEGAEPVGALAGTVRMHLPCPPAEFPFHPHVTVAQGLDDAALDRAASQLSAYECSFGVHTFSLYILEEGSGWVPLRDFGLG